MSARTSDVKVPEGLHDGEVIEATARAIWVQWYAGAVEREEIEGAAAGAGEDWMDVAPGTPDCARRYADAIWAGVLKASSAGPVAAALARDEVVEDLEGFGHYIGMEAAGTGVAWGDSNPPHGLKVPYAEDYTPAELPEGLAWADDDDDDDDDGGAPTAEVWTEIELSRWQDCQGDRD